MACWKRPTHAGARSPSQRRRRSAQSWTTIWSSTRSANREVGTKGCACFNRKLLDRLDTHYTPPEVTKVFSGNWTLTEERLREELWAWAQETKERIVLTGESSISAYAVMAHEPLQAFYCSNVENASKWLGESLRQTSRFANVQLRETRDKFVYFDQRKDLVASPIQAYLDLMTGDKREQEAAEQVRQFIMDTVKQPWNGEPA